MKAISIFLSLCVALVLLPSSSWALTLKKEEMEPLSEEEILKLLEVATKFTEIVPEFKGEDALDLAKLLEDVKNDGETKTLLEHMKSGEVGQNLGLQESLKNAKPIDILQGMINIFNELKAIDVLFKDPQRAVEEVRKEGMIEDASKLKFYRENPAQLQEDMRGGLYISFVYVASAGGYL